MTISKSLSKTILKIGLAVMMLLVITFCFSACGGLGRFDDNPNADDVVYGNGGLTVQKGDYLYFVNGYIDTSSVGETNNYGDIDQSAIYRVKLTDGNKALNILTFIFLATTFTTQHQITRKTTAVTCLLLNYNTTAHHLTGVVLMTCCTRQLATTVKFLFLCIK